MAKQKININPPVSPVIKINSVRFGNVYLLNSQNEKEVFVNLDGDQFIAGKKFLTSINIFNGEKILANPDHIITLKTIGVCAVYIDVKPYSYIPSGKITKWYSFNHIDFIIDFVPDGGITISDARKIESLNLKEIHINKHNELLFLKN